MDDSLRECKGFLYPVEEEGFGPLGGLAVCRTGDCEA